MLFEPSTRRISFHIPLKPVAQGRPRVDGRGRFPRLYYAGHVAKAKKRYKEEAEKFAPPPEERFTGPVVVKIFFISAPPTKINGQVKEWVKAGRYVCDDTDRGDLDNFVKLLMDAITDAGFFAKDDCQVARIECGKYYHKSDRGVYVELSEPDICVDSLDKVTQM